MPDVSGGLSEQREAAFRVARIIHGEVCGCRPPHDQCPTDPASLNAAHALLESGELVTAHDFERIEHALDDLLNWAEHVEGKGRLRRGVAIDQARAALARLGSEAGE